MPWGSREAERSIQGGSPLSESPHIVYVAGTSHGGSTLLDLVLGAHSRVVGLGELKVLCRDKDEKRARVLSDRCTCGAPFKLACEFWRKVDAHVQRRTAVDLKGLDVDASDRTTFVRHNTALFEALAEVAGTPWLVDSSKSPRRLKRLLRAGFDVRPILLTRGGHGVTYSHVRKGRGLARGALSYTWTRLRLEAVLRGRDHAAIRYEELVSNPERALSPVMAWLGLAFEPGQLEWTRGPNHQLCGNHMRFATRPEIRVDEAWRRDLSPLQKATVSCLTWPAGLAGRLGHRAQSRSTSR